jgi:hypothetical protein
MQALYIIIQLISAAFALAAAVLWLLASRDRAPIQIMDGIQSLGGPDIFGSHQVQLITALIKQSQLNARAAICAAVAAILQAVAIVISFTI